MSTQDRSNTTDNKDSLQKMHNWSFDDTKGVLVHGALALNGSNLEYLEKDANGNLKTTATVSNTDPTFSEDPNAGTPVAKHGLVDAAGHVQTDVVSMPNVTLGAGTDIVGYVSSTIAKKVGESKFYVADSGQIATDATNNWMNITLENPSGSGKTLYLVAITIESDTSGWATMHLNPTTNLPTTAKTAYNAINLGTGSSMNVKADKKTLQMDGTTTLVARVPSLTPIKLELPPFVFTPGNILALGVNLGGVANASFAAYWYEE